MGPGLAASAAVGRRCGQPSASIPHAGWRCGKPSAKPSILGGERCCGKPSADAAILCQQVACCRFPSCISTGSLAAVLGFEMGKRGLGIPHLAATSQPKKARIRALGIQLPPSTGSGRAAGSGSQPRKDAPVLRIGTQVRTSKGAKASDGLTDLSAALAAYDKDKYSAKAADSRRSVEGTWRTYHEKAHKLDPTTVGRDVFPVTLGSLKAIAALMKLDEYRSFSNYASWAKGAHIELGYEWTQQLALELTQAGRSLGRGLGPARQSAAFCLDKLANAQAHAVRVPGGPSHPRHAILLGSLWVLREIEIAWSKWEDITIREDGKVVLWTLTASKTDPAAKSCTRKWGCLCAELGQHICPYHVMIDYKARYLEHFGTIRGPDPLFPDLDGNVAQKAAVVQSLEQLMAEIGEDILDKAGRRRFGGHSCRVSGSRFWAGLGMEVQKLQIFARWGSDVILRYVSDAPLAQVKILARTSSPAALASSSASSSSADAKVCELGKIVQKLTSFVEDAVADLRQLQDVVATRGQVPRGDYVQNADSKCWHTVLDGGAETHPSQWRTWCGWRFGLQAHLRARAIGADGATCGRCQRQAGLSTRTSSSSSSGSSAGRVEAA